MTHSVAWAELTIGTKEGTEKCYLVRQLQLIADELPGKLCQGMVALPLNDSHSLDEYLEMDAHETLECAVSGAVEVRIPTAQEIEDLKAYTPELVATFWRMMND